MDIKFDRNGHIANLIDTVKAATCKAIAYKSIWVKDGKCTNTRPANFDLIKDRIYIVGIRGIDGIIFPKIQNYNELPPAPNCEYDSAEILESLFPLIHCMETKKLDQQINAVIKWCEKYGFPFFGDNGFWSGDISTCYRDTGCAGFNFMTFFRDLHYLNGVFTEMFRGSLRENFIADALNISMLQKTQKYTFVSHKLVCEIGFTTLISLAYYQLVYILMLPIRTDIKQCKQCGAFFITDNLQKSYCPKHSPQSHYAQKQRLKKKQTIANNVQKAPDTN